MVTHRHKYPFDNIFYIVKIKIFVILTIIMVFASCHKPFEHKTILCIPVYGQSLALGEEAERITDFDSLATYANGRIVTENLDHDFGHFDNNKTKLFVKKLVNYLIHSYELSIYNMSQRIVDATGSDTLICIFPGGQGGTEIAGMSKGTLAYQRFMENIKTAYEEASDNGWEFIIPAICWMQGESDIVNYPSTDYYQMLKQIREDMNADIKSITHQNADIPFICYQANSLTRAENFNAINYKCHETYVPQTFVNLLSKDEQFWASGPTYPYSCVNEKIHIDAIGQQCIGALAAKSALGILRGKERFKGLIPLNITTNDTIVTIHMDVPCPPLVIDTIQVSKAHNYGFSVINRQNMNIAKSIVVNGDSVMIHCSEVPTDCRIRYAVNGDYMKSGNLHGPRGNLRDSQGDSFRINIQGKKYPIHNWCYQFDYPAF